MKKSDIYIFYFLYPGLFIYIFGETVLSPIFFLFCILRNVAFLCLPHDEPNYQLEPLYSSLQQCFCCLGNCFVFLYLIRICVPDFFFMINSKSSVLNAILLVTFKFLLTDIGAPKLKGKTSCSNIKAEI